MSGSVLDHDIDLHLVRIAVIQQLVVALCAGGVLEQLAKNEGLQHLAEPAPIMANFLDAQVHEHGQQASVDELQLGRFDHAAQAVACPDVDALEQIHGLKNAGITGCRFAVQAHLTSQLRIVAHLPCGLRQGAQKPRQ